MPELPEVEAFKEYIETHCMHKVISDVIGLHTQVIQKINFSRFKKELVNNTFQSIERCGKYLIISLKKGTKKLIMHFGLSGSLFFSKGADASIPSTCIIFVFRLDGALYWISKRRLEKIWLVNTINEIEALKSMGIDALQITRKKFFELLEKSEKQNIKTFLMDQEKIAGIGNEYSDEILFQAGIDPHHRITDLSDKQRAALYIQIKKVLRYALKVQIKTSKKTIGPQFFSKEDRLAFSSKYLQSHRHVDMMCPKNKKHTLKRATIAGRTTYYCPEDQR
jgi:formamidopyrimidine-DNA glycosylase